jgi:hypothetical protein
MAKKAPSKAAKERASAWRAINYFFFLNWEQTKILFRKKVEGERSADEWIQLLENLAIYDAHSDEGRRLFRNIGWLTLAGILLMHLFGVQLGQLGGRTLVKYSEFFFRLLVAGSAISWFMYFFLRVGDLSNHLRLFLFPLIEILKQEMPPGAPIKLKIDLHERTSRKYRLRRITSYRNTWLRRFFMALPVKLSIVTALLALFMFYPQFFFATKESFWLDEQISHLLRYIGITTRGGREGLLASFVVGIFVSMIIRYIISESSKPKVITNIYDFFWLELEARMADGTLMQAKLDDYIVKRVSIKNSRSGKRTKIKHKGHIKTNYLLTIAFPKKQYQMQQGAGAVQKHRFVLTRKPNEKRHVLKLKGSTKQSNMQAYPDLQYFLRFVSNAYAQVRIAQEA